MKCSELLKKLKAAGWIEVRQSGSHIVLKHPEKEKPIVFPNHGSKELGKGLAQKLIKSAGL